jgi:ornithine cyclodeaminase
VLVFGLAVKSTSTVRIGGMTIVLDDTALLDRLRPAHAVAAMRAALLAAHRGELLSPARVYAGALAVTAGRLVGRWYGYRCYDTDSGGQQVVAVHLEPTGDVAAIAVGSALGAYRTGALGAVAADVLARPEAHTVGVIGAGRQAWTQLWALTAVRGLTDVAIYSRTPESRSTLAARVRTELGVPARTVPTAHEAVAARDIVVLATSSPTTVLDASWLAPGTAVTTVGPKQHGRAEFSADLPARAHPIVTDSLPQLRAYEPPALLAQAAAVSLGAVLAGDHPGRSTPDAVTLYASVGLAGTEPYLLFELLDQ